MKAPGIPDTLELPEPVKGARAVKQFSLRDGTILNGEYKLVFVDNRGAVYGLVEITCPTAEYLRERHGKLREHLTRFVDELNNAATRHMRHWEEARGKAMLEVAIELKGILEEA